MQMCLSSYLYNSLLTSNGTKGSFRSRLFFCFPQFATSAPVWKASCKAHSIASQVSITAIKSSIVTCRWSTRTLYTQCWKHSHADLSLSVSTVGQISSKSVQISKSCSTQITPKVPPAVLNISYGAESRLCHSR